MSNDLGILEAILANERTMGICRLDVFLLKTGRNLRAKMEARAEEFIFQLNVLNLPVTRRGSCHLSSACAILSDPLLHVRFSK